MFDREIVSATASLPRSLLERCDAYARQDAHHYFEIDTDVVFLTVQQDVPNMKEVVDRMIADMSQN